MPDVIVKFNSKIDRRSPENEGDINSPILRINWLSRDGRLTKPLGNLTVISGLTDIPRWMGRYHSIESGVSSPKTFVYTEDGKIYVLDDLANTATECVDLLNTNAYPRHWLFKSTNQTNLFFVDGKGLYSHDGNNDNKFVKVALTDSTGADVNPIDVIEHKDRLFVISKTSLYVSKNLEPTVFDDATDSIEIIVGSGKGTNLALGKIEDKLYIFNTEGIFALDGDVISALASTFEVRLVDERRIIAGRSACAVEKAIIFLADDLELWSWDGSSAQMLTYELKLRDFINPYKNMLEKATAVYYDNYYRLTFVETGTAECNMEIWWDAFENKVDLLRGRHVACYLKTDPTIEMEYMEMGKSNENKIVRDENGFTYDGDAIVTQLRTRDITPKKGHNVRFTAFYPEFRPTGVRTVEITYLLDGRSSNPSGADAYWVQSLRGETKTLGGISIKNQSQMTDRIRPKINYARGESIAFEIREATLGQQTEFQSMGIEYIVKHRSKGRTIGA